MHRLCKPHKKGLIYDNHCESEFEVSLRTAALKP